MCVAPKFLCKESRLTVQFLSFAKGLVLVEYTCRESCRTLVALNVFWGESVLCTLVWSASAWAVWFTDTWWLNEMHLDTLREPMRALWSFFSLFFLRGFGFVPSSRASPCVSHPIVMLSTFGDGLVIH
jgi:hypothetical protein